MSNPTAWLTSLTLTPHEAERFWSRVDKSGDCWLWLAPLTNGGYGTFGLRGTSSGSHRIAYMDSGRVIPAGLVLDHLCRVRHCVNPTHLEPVTSKTNSRRSPLVYNETHCGNGHELVADNVKFFISVADGSQQRYCKECKRVMSRETMRRRRSAAAEPPEPSRGPNAPTAARVTR